MMKLFGAYFMVLIFSLFIHPLISGNNYGFRTRIFVCSLWVLWLPLCMIGTFVSLIYAFIKDISVEKSLDYVFSESIFRHLWRLI